MKLILEIDLSPAATDDDIRQLVALAGRCESPPPRDDEIFGDTDDDDRRVAPPPLVEEEVVFVEGFPEVADEPTAENDQPAPKPRGRPRKDKLAASSAPAKTAAAPPASTPMPVFTPPGAPAPQEAAMPVVKPIPPAANGEMSLDELRAVAAQANISNPGLFFRVGRKYGWFTMEAVPATQRAALAEEIVSAAAA